MWLEVLWQHVPTLIIILDITFTFYFRENFLKVKIFFSELNYEAIYEEAAITVSILLLHMKPWITRLL